MTKRILSSAVFAACALASSGALAGKVSGLTSFTAGTPARAEEVNANFNAIKSAVDDNDARLSSVENTKQERVSEGCEVGSAITAIHADGSVSCGKFAKAGVVSVGADAFRSTGSNSSYCGYQTSTAQGGYFMGTLRACYAAAGISLPDGATITGFSCAVRDYRDREQISRIALKRGTFENRRQIDLAVTGASVNTAADRVQILKATVYDVPDYVKVDNDRYTYSIHVAFETDEDGGMNTVYDALALIGCKVSYDYP